MLQKTKFKIIFWTSLIAGVALCIGGIWVPALLGPGGALIAGALGMYQSAFVDPDHIEVSRDMVELTQVDNPISRRHENGTDHIVDANKLVIEQNIGLFFVYPNGRRSPLELEYPERTSAPTPSRLTLA